MSILTKRVFPPFLLLWFRLHPAEEGTEKTLAFQCLEQVVPMPHLLLTGAPGVGKTTLLRRLAVSLTDWRVRGFSTEEIRIGGARQGFRLVTFDGQERTLAHINFHTPYRVGRYGVDVTSCEALMESTLELDPTVNVYLIDEIGQMECFSTKFRAAVQRLLDSDRRVIATVAKEGGGFIAEVKRRADVELWEVTPENRTQRFEQLRAWLGSR